MKKCEVHFDAQIVDSIARLRYWLTQKNVDRSIFELLEKIESDYLKSIVAAPIPNATVGEGRMPKNHGDGMTRSMGTGLSPVGKAQIIHDNNGGEWLESQYPTETNSAQFPQNWSVFNKEASCQ